MLDANIPFLDNALDPVQAQGQLQTAIPPLQQVTGATLVRHKPGRRALVEYHVETATGPLTLLGKIRAKGTDRTSYQIQQALWHSGWDADSADGFSIPEPLGLVPNWHMALQRKVFGIPATQLLPGDQGIPLSRRIAALAHKLHRTPVPTPKIHTLADELRILRDRLPLVAEQHPPWAARIERVLDACDRLAAQFSDPGAEAAGLRANILSIGAPPPHHPTPGQTHGSAPTAPKSKIANPKFLTPSLHHPITAPSSPPPTPHPLPPTAIHRDFYADQVLVDGSRLWLVDLDLYCQGSPTLDIGNFIAHITEQSLREMDDAAGWGDREAALKSAYIDAYCGTHPGEQVAVALAHEIDLYAALTLVRHIHISTRIASRRPFTEALLTLCEARLKTLLKQGDNK